MPTRTARPVRSYPAFMRRKRKSLCKQFESLVRLAALEQTTPADDASDESWDEYEGSVRAEIDGGAMI